MTGENIVVSFNNCNPEPDDWIGVYAADADPNDLGDPLVWLWACGNQDCEESVLQGNATFFEARGSGAFKVFMVRRNSGGIYKAYGIGDQFWLATTCDWRRELTNSESHSLSAVFK